MQQKYFLQLLQSWFWYYYLHQYLEEFMKNFTPWIVRGSGLVGLVAFVLILNYIFMSCMGFSVHSILPLPDWSKFKTQYTLLTFSLTISIFSLTSIFSQIYHSGTHKTSLWKSHQLNHQLFPSFDNCLHFSWFNARFKFHKFCYWLR